MIWPPAGVAWIAFLARFRSTLLIISGSQLKRQGGRDVLSKQKKVPVVFGPRQFNDFIQ
jgi:hypothetical protein